MKYGFKQLNIDRINTFYANKNKATQRIVLKQAMFSKLAYNIPLLKMAISILT